MEEHSALSLRTASDKIMLCACMCVVCVCVCVCVRARACVCIMGSSKPYLLLLLEGIS